MQPWALWTVSRLISERTACKFMNCRSLTYFTFHGRFPKTPKLLHPFILPWYLLTLNKGTKKKGVRQKNKKGPQKNHIIMFWVRRKMERKLERTQTNASCVRSRNPMASHGELRKPVQTGLTSAITISFSPVSLKGRPKTTKNTNLNERPNLIIPLHQ